MCLLWLNIVLMFLIDALDLSMKEWELMGLFSNIVIIVRRGCKPIWNRTGAERTENQLRSKHENENRT